MQFRRRLLLPLLALATLAGCGRGGGEVTDLQRKQAAHLTSEAEFAINLRDYARAEPSLEQAANLAQDNGAYWINLGTVRKKLGKNGGAKDAYQAALKAYEAQAKKFPNEAEPWFKQIYALALLGRVEEARSRVEKMREKLPTNRLVRVFVEQKQIDQMLADPKFKEFAL
jgi:tetratricopeptide (TPR) repeat protein